MESSLLAQLEALEAHHRSSLEALGFDAPSFARLAEQALARHQPRQVLGRVEPPAAEDLASLPAAGSAAHGRLVELGEQALRGGHCALVVLAGGMATRMGGVVKALVEAVPGQSFLELRLAEQRTLERRFGVAPPLWLMTSDATDGPIRQALGDRLDGERVAVFRQSVALRLTAQGDLWRDASGAPSPYAPGHGDLPEALQQSGLLQRFLARGGRWLTLTNLDNLGAWLDPTVVGWQAAQGEILSCEVVERRATDRGGVPMRWEGRPVVLEEFRLSEPSLAAASPVFNTNSFHVSARQLAALRAQWTYFAVDKQVDDAQVLQLERLLGELTSFLPTRFLTVPRTGPSSRFLPVKDAAELEARRAEIEAALRARGVLP